MTLSQKQQRFAKYVALLIYRAYELDFAVTLGEAYRSKEEAARLAAAGKGIKNSLHCDRLAIDINLFRDGKYLTRTEAYRDLGEWWEKLDPPNTCWGGRFSDGNHFSYAHAGRK